MTNSNRSLVMGYWLPLIVRCSLLIVILLLSNNCFADESESVIARDFSLVKEDYKNFYLDTPTLIKLGAATGVAAVFANTSMDGDIRDYYQNRLRGNTTDGFATVLKVPGDLFITVPVLLGGHLLLPETGIAGQWTLRSLRAIAVGAPAGLILRSATGSGRPPDGDSRWRPFKHNDGLSAHTFIGAVPFITAAKMNDNLFLKGVFYGVSVLPGLSRINDDKHYFSQAALGWYLAYLSCSAVEKTNKTQDREVLSFVPLPEGGLKVVWSKEF